MALKNMTVEQLEERKAEIAAKIDSMTTLEEVQECSAEVDAINAELEARAAAEAKKAELRAAVAAGAGTVIMKMEENKMPDIKEIRNSAEYIEAYANAIKQGDNKFAECRALLSTNGTDVSASLTGYVPVPDLVDARVRTAWEKNNVMSLVRQTNLRGNVKVAFELSATGAVVHQEGTAAPNEEVITLGIVTMVPQSIKKWIECEVA